MQAIIDHLPAAMLVIFRIGGIVIFAPVFSSAAVPLRVRVLLTIVCGAAAYPTVISAGAMPEGLKLDLLTLGPLVAAEVFIGLAIGWIAMVPLSALQAGGTIAGQQMGLGFAQVYNPAFDTESDVVSELFFLLALAGYVAVGGIEQSVAALLGSFRHLPLAAFDTDLGLIPIATGLMQSALEVGLRVAAPLLAIVLLESIAMGFMGKTIPQLNLFSLGFPLRILLGLGVLITGLAAIEDVGFEVIDEMLSLLEEWT